LWSIHPKYLDRVGLLAVWREGLLGQKVLKGKTRGYVNHPQLERFRNHPRPQRAIAHYLLAIWEESKRRGYNFNPEKIEAKGRAEKIPVTRSQLEYEFGLLRQKLKERFSGMSRQLVSVWEIECHPMFKIIEGSIEKWEKIKPSKN
jgi:hypothetical protein